MSGVLATDEGDEGGEGESLAGQGEDGKLCRDSGTEQADRHLRQGWVLERGYRTDVESGGIGGTSSRVGQRWRTESRGFDGPGESARGGGR